MHPTRHCEATAKQSLTTQPSASRPSASGAGLPLLKTDGREALANPDLRAMEWYHALGGTTGAADCLSDPPFFSGLYCFTWLSFSSWPWRFRWHAVRVAIRPRRPASPRYLAM